MPSSGMLQNVALVRTDVSEQRSTYIIRVTRIRELGTTLAVAHRFLSPDDGGCYVPPKHRFLHEPHGVKSEKIAFFMHLYISRPRIIRHKT
jgi:hypothetical protein